MIGKFNGEKIEIKINPNKVINLIFKLQHWIGKYKKHNLEHEEKMIFEIKNGKCFGITRSEFGISLLSGFIEEGKVKLFKNMPGGEMIEMEGYLDQ